MNCTIAQMEIFSDKFGSGAPEVS